MIPVEETIVATVIVENVISKCALLHNCCCRCVVIIAPEDIAVHVCTYIFVCIVCMYVYLCV